MTCWTSFRQLENFIATKSYSNFAALTKVAAAKALTHGVWIAASERASGDTLGKAEIVAIFDPEAAAAKAPALRDNPSIDLGAQQFKDYRTTSEHWRVVLSIAHDEIARKDPRVKALSPEGAETLALVATELSLGVLAESGEIATHANTRGRYIKRDGTPITDFQVHGRTQNYSRLFERSGSRVRLRTD